MKDLKLLCQSDTLFEADIRFQKIVVCFDLPCIRPLTTQILFLLSGAPAIAEESIAVFVTLNMGGW